MEERSDDVCNTPDSRQRRSQREGSKKLACPRSRPVRGEDAGGGGRQRPACKGERRFSTAAVPNAPGLTLPHAHVNSDSPSHGRIGGTPFGIRTHFSPVGSHPGFKLHPSLIVLWVCRLSLSAALTAPVQRRPLRERHRAIHPMAIPHALPQSQRDIHPRWASLLDFVG
ncbi:hypothetical protein K437DRAFT_178965 [Tilletiaria anomala UBC 951]|uniref:Uncharacterized protein n=1 Tax=Tilletiaria anomala (strain ATCC 24038 / CBS 436.72 / UBC 951) TaxID=1037660 RepID=A0A066VR24_TILAU|nr:uncharacterized protein K437DRAFT_178965 [Tilletiaria anomala UBC 951]KDN41244.1 hypothetical protein K437DRAFT_178965 [Tilletiaria anomala UBC 951]